MKEKYKKTDKQRQKRARGREVIVKRWELNGLCVHLRFLQLMCKSSLIFKSTLELPSLIILKQRELYESKYIAVECRCLKI